jgi:hypothetical protein
MAVWHVSKDEQTLLCAIGADQGEGAELKRMPAGDARWPPQVGSSGSRGLSSGNDEIHGLWALALLVGLDVV